MDPEDEKTPVEAAPPAVPAVEATPPAAPEPGPAPWAQDLATYIEDETAREQADRYLREKVQPHTTKLETELAESRDARALWHDLTEDPVGTYLAVTSEMFGAEYATRFGELIEGGLTPAEAQQVVEQEAQQEAPEDPVLAEMKADYEAKQRAALFDSELERIKALPEAAGLLIDRKALAPFVIESGGDFDAALVGYREYVESLRQHYAPVPPEPEPEPEPAPPAPLGTQPGGAPAATPPVAKRYGSIADAVSDYLDETRAAPTTLGSV